MEILLSAVLGGLVTWGVTHYYDRQAMVRVPGWARPLLDRLPKAVPSREEMRALLQEVIEGLEFRIEDDESEKETDCDDRDECPSCRSEELEVSEDEDEDGKAFESVECLDCGWQEEREV